MSRAIGEMDIDRSADIRDDHVRRIVSYIADLCDGIRVLGENENCAPMSIINRAIVEQFITLRWVTLDAENAEQQSLSSKTSFLRAAKANMEAGLLGVFQRDTGENATGEFLASSKFSDLPRQRNIEQKAAEAGLKDIYLTLYRFMSLDTHGHSSELSSRDTSLLIGQLHLTGAVMRAAGHSAIYWIRAREVATIDNIRALLFGEDEKITYPPSPDISK